MRYIFLLILTHLLSFSLPSFAHSASPEFIQNPVISSVSVAPPIEPSPSARPLQPQKGKKSRFSPRPSWDIFWLIGSVVGLGLFPFALAGFLLGLGYAWPIICAVGLGLEIAWWLSLLFLHIALINNRSDADHFFEKNSLLLLMAGLILHGLGMLIVGLLGAGLLVWLGGLLVAAGAGAGLYFLLKK